VVDIHQYEQRYTRGERLVQTAAISARNKDLIFRYRDACLLHGVCGTVRLTRVFDVLTRTAIMIGKDFDAVSVVTSSTS